MSVADIIAKLEAATEGTQLIVLEEAVKFADAQRWIDREAAHQALAWIKQGAFLEAVRLLVPKGALWDLDYKLNIGPAEDGYRTPEGEPETIYRAGVGIVDFSGDTPSRWSRAKHFAAPSLALCIAVLKARAMERPNG